MRKWSDYMQSESTEPEIFNHIRKGKITYLLQFLADGGDPNLKNHKGHSLLMLASYNGHLLLVPQLIRFGADVNLQDHAGNTILMGVAFKGHTEIARLLLKAGADVHAQNHHGQTALMYAEAFGRESMSHLFRLHAQMEVLKRLNLLHRMKACFQLVQSPLKGEKTHI